MCRFTVENSKTKTDLDVLALEEAEDKSITDLFRDFYMLQNNNVLPSEKLMSLLTKVLDDMEVTAK